MVYLYTYKKMILIFFWGGGDMPIYEIISDIGMELFSVLTMMAMVDEVAIALGPGSFVFTIIHFN